MLGLIISVDNFTRQTITYLTLSCLLLFSGLIQLNHISLGKHVMFVQFVVYLFADSDGWKYCQELSSETDLLFACLFIKRKLIDRYFFVYHVLLTRTVSLRINEGQVIEM